MKNVEKFNKMVKKFNDNSFNSLYEKFLSWNVFVNEFALDSVEDEIEEYEVSMFGSSLSQIHRFGAKRYFELKEGVR